MNKILRYISNLYSQALHLYPRSFRDEFADEMKVVFRNSVREADRAGTAPLVKLCLKELGGLPFNILREFWHEFERKEMIMDTNEQAESQSVITGGTSHWDALIGTLPFVLFGIASIIGKLRLPFFGIYADLVFYVIVLLGLLLGLIKGFPRWAYSYLGWSLVFAWWWSDMGTQGLKILGFTINYWTWQIWIPLLAALGLALAWTRSLNPIRQLAKGIWQDWTLLSLAMYTFVGWMALIYDENHHPYLFAFMIASTLAISGSVWAFMRSDNTRARIFALLSGFIAVGIIGWICESTWDWRGHYGLPPQPVVAWYVSLLRAVVIIAVWGGILFWPALVGLVRRAVNNHRMA